MRRYTTIEAAARLRRHPELVRRWLRDGRLRGEQSGRDWLVTEREIARFLRTEPQRRARRA
jgi:excisionase family DNA binding protein